MDKRPALEESQLQVYGWQIYLVTLSLQYVSIQKLFLYAKIVWEKDILEKKQLLGFCRGSHRREQTEQRATLFRNSFISKVSGKLFV